MRNMQANPGGLEVTIIGSFPEKMTGMPRVNVEFLKRMLKDDRVKTVDLICSPAYNHFPEIFKNSKLKIHNIWLSHEPWRIREFLKIVNKNSVVLILDIPTFSNVSINIFKKRSGAKVVQHIPDLISYTEPQTLPKITNFFYHLFGFFLKNRVDKYFVTTESVRNDLIKYWKVRNDLIHKIPLDSFIESQKPRKNFGNNKILYVGSIESRKNIKRLIDAFVLVQDKISNSELVLVGKTGKDGEEIEEYIQKFIDEGFNIIRPGFLSDQEVLNLYRTSDLFLFPSLYEGFGLPPLEAMTSGCPVIVSNVSSLPEVVGDAGILVDPNDTNAMSDAIIGLLNDNDLKEMMSMKGVERSKDFSWDKSTDLLIKLLQS